MIHKLLHPALMAIMKLQRTQELIILNEHPQVSGNVIYVVNHSCVHDMPIASEVIKRHTWVLAAKQRLRLMDYNCFWVNSVYVDFIRVKPQNAGILADVLCRREEDK